MSEYRADANRASWLTVVDTEIGDKIVGAALWHTYVENPYPVFEEHPVEAYWWAEGEFFFGGWGCCCGGGGRGNLMRGGRG